MFTEPDSSDNGVEPLIWETAEMFDLRKRFIEKYQGYEEFLSNPNRLHCLAQLLINMEFLRCNYDPEIEQRVSKMASGLLESHRAERQKVLSTVLSIKNDKPPSAPPQPRTTAAFATLASPEIRPAPKRTTEHDHAEFVQTKVVKKTEYCYSDTPINSTDIDLNNSQSATLPANNNTTVPSFNGFWSMPKVKTVAELKLTEVQSVKAQLCLLIDRKLNALECLNSACQVCKVTWKIDFLPPPKEIEHESVPECRLSIGDVVIVRMCRFIDEENTRSLVCNKSVQILRTYSNLHVKRTDGEKFELYASLNSKQLAHGPQTYMFEPLEHALLQFKEFWINNRFAQKINQPILPKSREKPLTLIDHLSTASNECFSVKDQFSVRAKRSQGWNEDIIVSLCGVELMKSTLKVVNRASEDEFKLKICREALDLVLSLQEDKFKINRDAETGLCRLVLVPKETPKETLEVEQDVEESKSDAEDELPYISYPEEEKLVGRIRKHIKSEGLGDKNAAQIIHEACSKAKVALTPIFGTANFSNIEFEKGQMKSLVDCECKIVANNIILGRGISYNKKVAKSIACNKAYELLSKEKFKLVKFEEDDEELFEISDT